MQKNKTSSKSAAKKRVVRPFQSIKEKTKSVHASPQPLEEELLAISERNASRKVLDKRSPDEILGYDENGLV